MKAIVHAGQTGKATFVTDRPAPRLRPGYLQVEVKTVAMNPTDHKHIDTWNNKGVLAGCDFAGVVSKLGSGYSKEWKVGDRICGFVHGGNELEPEDGAFAEQIVVKADIGLRFPESMSFEEAATLGVGVITVGQAMFMQMGLRRPTAEPKAPATEDLILIYGGSSATGSMAIQFAKLAGLVPITVCSRHNFAFVKSLGAAAAFDYKDADCVDQIKTYIGPDRELKYVFDTISTTETAEICGQVIASGGLWAYILLGTKFPPRDDAEKIYPLAYLSVGERVKKAKIEFPPSQRDFDFVSDWMLLVEELLQKGLLKPHPRQVEHGLENVLNGLELMRAGKVSGKKLVYTV
ncbi:Alcohol dehydrogenase GroES-like domain-containing protein [Cladophialophora immunda]|nr:Alcohol dehydrogenase GroES-like domain-containing protein [Cladophialophora immunda]